MEKHLKLLSNSWIKLNVGGHQFNTTTVTLLKGDTMLSRMFSGDVPTTKDENGAILIDRDGKHFNKILNFLRSGIQPVLESEREATELKHEAEFYGIGDLKEYCENYGKLQNSAKKVVVYPTGRTWGYKGEFGGFEKSSEPSKDIPLMPDGTMSLGYICNTFSNNLYGSIFVVYWKSADGKPTRTALEIKHDKVMPPEHGWYACPEWAFDGPYYYALD